MFVSSSNGIPSKAGEFGTVIRAVLLASTKNGSPIGVPVSGGAFDSRGCTSMGTSRLLSTLIVSPWLTLGRAVLRTAARLVLDVLGHGEGGDDAEGRESDNHEYSLVDAFWSVSRRPFRPRTDSPAH